MGNVDKCQICIRECPVGVSFCKRRDAEGKLKNSLSFCAIAVGNLFDKPLIHFAENHKVLSIGSWGCNLRCLGCQNRNLSCAITPNDIEYIELTPQDIVELALKNGCKGICYTYNEPAILMESVEAIARTAKDHGLYNILVTNSTSSIYSTRKLASVIDAVAADIKSLNPDYYHKYCGANGIDNVIEKILTCIQTFHDEDCHVEVRTNIIPGGNSHDHDFQQIAGWIYDHMGSETPWHVTRFFPAHELSHIPKTPMHTMIRAQEIGFSEGLNHVHLYFEHGCDCAKTSCLVSGGRIQEVMPVHSCCG